MTTTTRFSPKMNFPFKNFQDKAEEISYLVKRDVKHIVVTQSVVQFGTVIHRC